MSEDTQNETRERGLRKERVGTVVSAKQDKTLVVQVDRRTAHPLYKKVVTTSKKYYAHDEDNKANEGDVVRIQESRPLSKLKRWRLVDVVRQAED